MFTNTAEIIKQISLDEDSALELKTVKFSGDVLMLNLKEQTIKELDELKPEALAKVYNLITELKRKNQAPKSKTTSVDYYIKVREALKQCKGYLSYSAQIN